MTRKPRALVFAPAFAPVFFSEALVNSKLALAMLNAGWEVNVFTAATRGGDAYAKDWSEPWFRLRELQYAVSPQATPGRLGRALTIVRNAIAVRHPVSGSLWAEAVARQALALHRERPFDVMLSRSTSCFAHLPAMLLRRELRIPWIANWNDPPGHLFPAPYSYPLSSAERFFKNRYLRAAAQMADVNSFPSRELMDYLRVPLGLERGGRSVVLPHVGLGRYGQSTLSRPGRFRISHAGNLSRERDPSSFLRALAGLVQAHPQVQIEFEIIGQMDDSFAPLITELGLDRVVLRTPGLPFLDCLRRLEESDALLLIEAPCAQGIFFPSKLVDYAEAGRPVLALSPEGGVVENLIRTYRFGEFAPVEQDEAIKSALNRLFAASQTQGPTEYDFAAIRDYTAPSRLVTEISAAAGLAATCITAPDDRTAAASNLKR